MTGHHMLAPGGDHRPRLCTIQQTSSVLPATLGVTNNDRQRSCRSEMNFKRRSADIHLQTVISIIGFSEFPSFNLKNTGRSAYTYSFNDHYSLNVSAFANYVFRMIAKTTVLTTGASLPWLVPLIFS
ncbi:hypothetical protein [Geomicrobium sp. JCM 19039]|uniref:hypothetical protein n=1 Tax=Geomicrobium sp. JCM 19039 TaxID=1460636 RepID=UPI00045F42C3|nr:hypothetical protein [Geomicrobium sp. JCM 19039]GAK11736.1 hypothetical protein JCM19039_1451 [Geomicrobium sp. JCM 19039]